MELNVVKLSDDEKYVLVNELQLDGHVFYQVTKVNGDDDYKLVEKIENQLYLVKDENIIKAVLNKMLKKYVNTEK